MNFLRLLGLMFIYVCKSTLFAKPAPTVLHLYALPNIRPTLVVNENFWLIVCLCKANKSNTIYVFLETTVAGFKLIIDHVKKRNL